MKQINLVYRRLWMTLVSCLVMVMICCLPAAAAGKSVAAIGGKKYTSLESAVKSAKSGQTIKVLSDITTTSCVGIKKNVVIDFAGKRYTYNGYAQAFDISKGKVTLKNGVLNAGNLVRIHRKAEVIVSGKNGKYNGLWENEGKLSIAEGTFTNANNNVIINYGGNVKISKGTFKCTKSGTGESVLRNLENGTCTINNGTFYGKEIAIDNVTGKVTIKKGSFTSDKNSPIYNSGKMVISGGNFIKGHGRFYLLVNTSDLVIKGGYFKGDIGNEIEDGRKLCISGGKFECDYRPILYNLSGCIEVTGGSFYTPNNNTVWNTEEGELFISRGSFRSGDFFVVCNFGDATITGGTFTVDNGASAILHQGVSLNISNNVVMTGKVEYES